MNGSLWSLVSTSELSIHQMHSSRCCQNILREKHADLMSSRVLPGYRVSSLLATHSRLL